jgi:hypothetical protein
MFIYFLFCNATMDVRVKKILVKKAHIQCVIILSRSQQHVCAFGTICTLLVQLAMRACVFQKLECDRI